MSDLLYGVAIVAIGLYVFYRYLTSPYDYFKKQGVECAPSPLPGFGHTLSVVTMRENLSDVIERLYRSCPDDLSMMGLFHGRTPILMVRELELVRAVLATKFYNFKDNVMHLDEGRDWFLTRHPFLATGVAWKKNRTFLLNGMSSNKLKILFEPLKRVIALFDQRLEEILSSGNTEVLAKSLTKRVTGDMISHIGLGVGSEEDLARISKEMFEESRSNAIRQLLNFYLKGIAAAFGISYAPTKVRKYFDVMMKRATEGRRQKRNDELFLDMVMRSEDADESLVAGVVAPFFFEAFESAASSCSFQMYMLSKHQDIQKRLRDEIRDTLAKYDGEITFQSLKEMPYLDQVISESIRLNMNLPIGVKLCNKTTTLRGSDGQVCTLHPGHIAVIPTQYIQTDPKFFPNPYAFDPSRFDPDKKGNIPKYGYLPFGEGPRMCAGKTFGQLEFKIMLVTILRKCVLKPLDRTAQSEKMPYTRDERSVTLAAKGGLWIKLERAET